MMNTSQTIIVLLLGGLLFAGGIFGGIFLQGYLAGQTNTVVPPQSESLSIDGYVTKLLTEYAIKFNVRNAGKTNIQISSIALNGHTNSSTFGLAQGWNGTTYLQPGEYGTINVYAPAYVDVINETMPILYSQPIQAQLENIETWATSFNSTFTFATSTGHQYDRTLTGLGLLLMLSITTWGSSQSYSFMNTEQLSVTSAVLTNGSPTITLTVTNSGSTSIVLNNAYVNNVAGTLEGAPLTIDANAAGVTVTVTAAANLASGNAYQIKVMSAKGNSFVYTAVCP